MSFLQKSIELLDKFLSQAEVADPLDDEQEHMRLLAQSAARIKSTVRAIQNGNLIAASSVTENCRASKELDYQEMRKSFSFARGSMTVGAISGQRGEVA